MNNLIKFYTTVWGRVFIDACVGLAVGFLIYLWRGAENALWLCAASAGFLSFLKIKLQAESKNGSKKNK